ncbi:hypothetical protein GEM21_05445 [Salmonella enterica]|nr:hypothetical protein [Salmonella enterica]
MIAAANGGGAAIGTGANAVSAAYATTATPSLQILAGSGYGVGGNFATTLGGEAQIGNTGLSTGSSWGSKAKEYYDYYQKINSLTKGNGQQEQSQQPPQFQQIDMPRLGQVGQYQNPQQLTGINFNDQSGVPDFTKAGTFGGFN